MSRVNARNMYRSLINVLYVNKQEFSASCWRSNQGYTKMHGQPTIKIRGDLQTEGYSIIVWSFDSARFAREQN